MLPSVADASNRIPRPYRGIKCDMGLRVTFNADNGIDTVCYSGGSLRAIWLTGTPQSNAPRDIPEDGVEHLYYRVD